jgi:hypothetical protein
MGRAAPSSNGTARGRDGDLGEAAEAGGAEHAIPHGEPLHAVAHGPHDARDLRPRHEGKRGLHLVAPLHHQDVEEVAAGGAHLDLERLRRGLGLGDLLHLELPGLQPAIDDDGAHGVSQWHSGNSVGGFYTAAVTVRMGA